MIISKILLYVSRSTQETADKICSSQSWKHTKEAAVVALDTNLYPI